MTTTNFTLADVQTIALNTMSQHGLIQDGWAFSFDRAKKRLGACNYTHKMITMSRILTPSCSWENIQNTILHEIAHALVGGRNGHNHIWKAKAVEIGCTGERCGSVDDGPRPEFRWYAICDNCDLKSGMHRAPGRVRSCPSCYPWGFSWQNQMRWTQWGSNALISDMPEKFQREYQHLSRIYNPNHSTANYTEDHNV